MKQFLLVSLGIIITIMLCSCSAQSSKTSDQSQSNNTPISQGTPTTPQQPEVQQEGVSIMIEPPSGWEPVAGTVLPVQYLKNMVSFMVKEEKFQGKTLDDVITEAKKAFENAFDDVEYEGEAETITVDGKDARSFIFTCKVSGMQMKYKYVYLLVGGKASVITFGGPVDAFDSLSADYEQILSDIRFQ